MKKNKTDNYLDFVPQRNEIRWDTDDSGLVTLYIENRKLMQRITQKLLKKPKVSQVHLESYGSFIWQQIDGKRTIWDIASLADEKFGEELHPLYERIISYFNILKQNGFISLKKGVSPGDQ